MIINYKTADGVYASFEFIVCVLKVSFVRKKLVPIIFQSFDYIDYYVKLVANTKCTIYATSSLFIFIGSLNINKNYAFEFIGFMLV